MLRCLPVLLLVWLSVPALAAGDKVTICHIPPGNPENVQIIEVSAEAAQKHIDRHGDSIFGGQEICDGVDNDCNGFVDDGFPLGQFCEDGISDCRQTGVLVCDPDDATRTTCSAVALDPAEPGGESSCQGGSDEDCDGQIDCADPDCAWDGNPSDLTCKDPVCPDGIVDAGEECDGGACCTPDCTFASAGTVCGIDEVCRHEVCDAEHECVVENLQASCDTDPAGPNNSCDTSTDACEAGVCVNSDPSPIPEARCDGIDNDCDPATPDVEDEVCGDGIDNDCDAAIDEDCGGANCDACASDCTTLVVGNCTAQPVSCTDPAGLVTECMQQACPDCVPSACEVCVQDCAGEIIDACIAAGPGSCSMEDVEDLIGGCASTPSCSAACTPCEACTEECVALTQLACIRPEGCTPEEAFAISEGCVANNCSGVCL
jgi:hypothetical protein